jgi:hypothetical protein
MERMMNEFKLGVCILDKDENMLAHRSLYCHVSDDLVQDMKALHDIDVKQEMLCVLWDELKKEVRPAVLNRLYEKAEITGKEDE